MSNVEFHPAPLDSRFRGNDIKKSPGMTEKKHENNEKKPQNDGKKHEMTEKKPQNNRKKPR